MKIFFIIAYSLKLLFRKIQNFFNDASCKYSLVYGKGAKFMSTATVENISKRKENIRIGKQTIVRGNLVVFGYGGKIILGENVYVGVGSNIWSGESVFIGDNVLISHNVNIIDTNSHELDHLIRAERYLSLIKNGHPKDKSSIITGSIVIGNYAWVSFGATVLKGVTIGEGAIVAACAVVTKDVPPFTVVAGNPAKVVKNLK